MSYVTLRQSEPLAGLLTRVTSVFRTIVWGAMPLGGLYVATIGSAIGPSTALIIAAISTTVCLVPLSASGLKRAVINRQATA